MLDLRGFCCHLRGCNGCWCTVHDRDDDGLAIVPEDIEDEFAGLVVGDGGDRADVHLAGHAVGHLDGETDIVDLA